MIPRPEALADLAIKSTLLLAVGSLAVASLSRRRPALAAACGHAALVGLWLLPLALFLVPQLNWHILPAEPVEQPLVSSTVEPSPEPPALPDFALSTPALTPPGPLPDFTPEPPPPAPIIEPEPLPSAEPWAPVSLALAAYATVSGLFLVRLAFALLAVRRLVRRSTPVLDSPWTAALAELSTTGNHVQLLWSDRLSVPVVVGWLRPAILLPAHLQSSDAPTARAVLLHELAHIHRRDYPWNVFLRLTLSFYWPHPLAWLLSRTLSESRENACDAYCVHALGGPAPYADALLSVVSLRLQSRIPTPSLGLAMARPSRLRTRLARLATLPGTPTVNPSLPARLLLLFLMIPLSALLGPLHLAPAQAEPLAEPAGRILTLRVVSAETGMPLPKPTARVWLDHNEDDRTGDDRGLLKITHSTTAADRTIVVDVAAPGHAMQRHFFNDPAIPEEFTVKLHPGETLGGIVQDEQGKPIAGATVLLSNYDFKRKDSHEFFYELATTSGPDGRWQTTSAPHTDSKSLDLKVIHPDFARIGTYGRPGATATLEDLRANRAVVTLRKGVAVEGRVTDDQGRPVANADVYLAPPTYVAYHRHDVDRTRTDADGRFRLGQVQPGEWAVYVIAGGFAPFHVTSKAEAESLDLNVRLNPGHVLKGRVVDGDGKPIAGAVTHWLTWNGVPCLNVKLRTDEQGRFRWDGAPKDGIAFRIDALGYSPIGQASVKADAEEETYTLKPSLSVIGMIMDATTNAYIKNATVEYGAADPETGEVAEWLDPMKGRGPSRMPLIGLDIPAFADAFRLRITADNYEPYVSRLIRTSEKSLMGFEARLTPIGARPQANATTPTGPRTLTLRVISAETGKPLPKPEAHVLKYPRDEWLSGDEGGVLKITHSTGLDDRALFIEVAAPGHALQRHSYGRSARVPIPDEVTIKLQPGETLGGIAQDEQGRPVAGAEILLWSTKYTRKDPSELLHDLRAVSGPDGRWQTTSAPKTNGEIYGYKLRHPSYISELRTVASGDDLPTIADLRAGKAVIVLKKGVPIEGRVTDSEGRPVDGASIIATSNPSLSFTEFTDTLVKTDSTGRFRHGQVKPGVYHIVAQAPGYAPGRTVVRVDQAIPRVSLTLDKGRVYRGRVVDNKDRPIANAGVTLVSLDIIQCIDMRTRTDSDGQFRFDHLPFGAVTGSIMARGFYAVTFQVDDRGEDITHTLQPNLSISGRVRESQTGKDIPRARVEFGKPDHRTGEVDFWRDVSQDHPPFIDGFLQAQLPGVENAYRIRIVADGYAPAVSRIFKVDEQVVDDYDMTLTPLRPGDAPTAVVTASDGKPLVGARVHTLQPVIMNTVDAGSLILQSTTAPRDLRTDKEGRFVLPFASGLLLILGDREFAILSQKEVAAQANKIQSKPYARVEGRLLRAGRPMPNRPVRLHGTLRREEVQPGLQVSVDSEAMTDAEGRFVFEKVLPLPTLRVKMADGVENGIERRSQGKPIHPRPGETLRVQVGGGGRPVVGLAALPDNMPQPVSFSQYGKVCLTNGSDRIPYPLSVLRGTSKLNFPALAEWKRSWDASPEARAIEDRWRDDRQSLELDGSFRIDDVPPGRYQLWLSYGETDGTKAKQPPLTLLREVTVPEGPSDAPLDLGTLLFESLPVAQIGRPAPVVRATGLDGKPVSTESYKGKYVVVSFETISTPARLEIPDLNALHAKRRDDPRVAFLSVILAPDDDATRRYARDKGQPWTQAIHPPNPAWMSSPFFQRDHYYLIAPDGTLAYRAPHPSDLEKFLPALPENPQEKPQPAPTKPQGSTARPAGREFTLRVVSAETGKPVGDAEVRVSVGFKEEVRKTDQDGLLKIRHSSGPEDRWLSLEVLAPGYGRQERMYPRRLDVNIPDEATMTLHRGMTLGGFVRDEQGRPIAGALVLLTAGASGRKDPDERCYDLPAVSGPDGRWQTTSAPSTNGEYLAVRCFHKDYASVREYSYSLAPPFEQLKAGTGVIVLKKGVPIDGRVVDRDGKPVAGAEVRNAKRSDMLPQRYDIETVRTDADGRFRLSQVGPGTWHIGVQAKSHAPLVRRVEVKTEIPFLELVLDPPSTFRGRVVDLDGKPVAGAWAALTPGNPYRFLGKNWWTDADGRFTWQDGPKDGISLDIHKPGFAALKSQELSADGQEHPFQVRPMIVVTGTIKESVSGRPIPRGYVIYRPVLPNNEGQAAWVPMPNLEDWSYARDGEYLVSILVDPKHAQYEYRIQSEGNEEFRAVVDRSKGPVQVINATVRPAKSLTGQALKALDPSGQTTTKARVYAISQGAIRVEDGTALMSSSHAIELGVGSDGTFPMPDMGEDCVVAVVGDDFFGYADTQALKASPVIRTARYAALKGRHLIGDRPVAGQELQLYGSLQLKSTAYVAIIGRAVVKTDSEGRFHAEKLVPMQNYRVERRTNEVGRNWIDRLSTGIDLKAGETTEFQFGGTGRAVTGRVAPPDGWTKPIDFTMTSGVMIKPNTPVTPWPLELLRGKTSMEPAVWRWSSDWMESSQGIAYQSKRCAAGTALASDGTFRIDDLPPGEYRVEVSVNETSFDKKKFGPFSRAIREFTVPAGPSGKESPIDLGTIRLSRRVGLKVGEKVPEFEVKTADGKTIRSADYLGKYLLLDLGGLWDSGTRLQIPKLNAARAKHGDEAKLAFLSLVFSPDTAETRKFVADKGQGWPQAIVGALSNPLADRLGIEDGDIPSALLIAPDGTLAARGHDPVQIVEAIKAK